MKNVASEQGINHSLPSRLQGGRIFEIERLAHAKTET